MRTKKRNIHIPLWKIKFSANFKLEISMQYLIYDVWCFSKNFCKRENRAMRVLKESESSRNVVWRYRRKSDRRSFQWQTIFKRDIEMQAEQDQKEVNWMLRFKNLLNLVPWRYMKRVYVRSSRDPRSLIVLKCKTDPRQILIYFNLRVTTRWHLVIQ